MNLPELAEAEKLWLELLLDRPITSAEWDYCQILVRNSKWNSKRLGQDSTWVNYHWRKLLQMYWNIMRNLPANSLRQNG